MNLFFLKRKVTKILNEEINRLVEKRNHYFNATRLETEEQKKIFNDLQDQIDNLGIICIYLNYLGF